MITKGKLAAMGAARARGADRAAGSVGAVRQRGQRAARGEHASLPVGILGRAHLAAGGAADEPDDPGRQDHMVEGHGTTNPYVFYTPAIPSLCIPAVGLEDGPNGVADGMTGVTQLPSGVSLAATWDPSLAQQYGQVTGAEEYGKGASANLGPTVNIDRDPRWGRSFEALSRGPVP